MEENLPPVECSVRLQDTKVNICIQCKHRLSHDMDPDQPESPDQRTDPDQPESPDQRTDPDQPESPDHRTDPDQPESPDQRTDESSSSVTERLERTHLHTDDGIECHVCSVRKLKALNSCLGCLTSCCDTHLKINTDPRTDETQTCSHHGRPLEVYCRSDQMCICFLCVLDEHKGHDVLSITQWITEKQTKLEDTKKITDQETELDEVKKASDTLKNLSEATEEEAELIFTGLMDFIQKSHTETTALIQDQKRAQMKRIDRHVEDLEENLSELYRKRSELRQSSSTESPLSYLQMVQSSLCSSQRDDISSLTLNPQFSFGEVIKSLYTLKQQMTDMWTLEMRRICSSVKRDQILLPSEPKTREDILQFLVPLSLDPNTAHRNLRLTNQNQSVTCSTESQSYPDHPERFKWWAQVLTSEGLTGRSYWEVIWTGMYGVDIAVAYRDIKRTGEGDDSGFGYNSHSWSLDCSLLRCALVHNNTETETTECVSHRIGVYLDHRAGLLSFYNITDSMTLLHRVQKRFTQPLYPGFGLFQGSTVTFCEPEEHKNKKHKSKTTKSTFNIKS